jgi:hypothetical protein
MKRPHSSLAYLTPVEFKTKILSTNHRAAFQLSVLRRKQAGHREAHVIECLFARSRHTLPAVTLANQDDALALLFKEPGDERMEPLRLLFGRNPYQCP